ncbi:TIM-barrel domain-containing protein [Bifidobacterium simiarum]|uniref:Family 31 glucosidase n=1 Tax=Bifidobacterium simiarum TaxID=2045441 RepID=A0A2M9HCQ1_9BIFI|nr:glycoside hydrolase family 31 protein [Bifidobacterium simiarum]PJM74593.1 family 31 glucosidase [Bifidobacterium simiarum]
MNAVLERDGERLVWRCRHETLWLEPWGPNALRVRGTKNRAIDENLQWALNERPVTPGSSTHIELDGAEGEAQSGRIVNGSITAEIDQRGWISFRNADGKVLLEEFWQIKDGGDETSAVELPARDWRPVLGGDWRLTMRFKAHDDERIYGLGQRQIHELDLKGCVLELAQRNSQASIPFMLSNRGYGLLWNNPAIGRVSFARNLTEWEAERTDQLDYWICAGDTPAQIEEQYSAVTGHVPMMPDWAMGFWQCKLRYKTQEELLRVARGYKERGVPISVIVVDFFHWPQQGEWKFDPKYWPDPAGMVRELESMGIKLMVSIWPTVDVNSENWDEMESKGYLVSTDRGTPTLMNFMGNESYFDAFNPGARAFVWSKAKEHYYDKGVRLFWLDEAEPDLSPHYSFDIVRYDAGPALKVGGFYPVEYAKTFYEGQRAAGQHEGDICNLLRCAWAGSQRYGALLWSGDVHSTFESFRRQVVAGLNAGISGIPWWTTDIGGFTGGDVRDPKFHELLVRWFQFGVFCPVMRLHGFRVPIEFDVTDAWRKFNEPFCSGADNEIWSYGDDLYRILKSCIELRERLRPYVAERMRDAHEQGTPVIRPLFYDFPDDPDAWGVDDEYLFGPDVLVAPILYEGQRSREVRLPKGADWVFVGPGQETTEYQGGAVVEVPAPLDHIPVFVRKGAGVLEALQD